MNFFPSRRNSKICRYYTVDSDSAGGDQAEKTLQDCIKMTLFLSYLPPVSKVCRSANCRGKKCSVNWAEDQVVVVIGSAGHFGCSAGPCPFNTHVFLKG